MASIRNHGKGWRAEVSRSGVRRSKVFRTRREATDWAAQEEWRILHAPEVAAATPFGEVMHRYAREVSPTKRGARWEIIRLSRLADDPLGAIAMRDLAPADLAAWRDRRLREVSPGSVRREMGLLGAVLTLARREWGLLASSPMEGVRKPSAPPPRDRLPTADELARLAHAAGDDLRHATARAFHAFRFSMETAMRAGEVCALGLCDVDPERRVARLRQTKNGRPREVPLSSEALRLLQALPPADPLFGLTPRQLDALWRKVRARAQVDGLTFHDSRHAAITMLAGRLDVLALARMVGHRDLRQLVTYYNESAADLAKRLG